VKVTELFLSIQGEGIDAGRLCAFVRLTGCSVRCGYCDTEYAFYDGIERSIDSILEELAGFGARLVCVTGGEPMSAPEAVPLLERLVAEGYEVLLETSGVVPLDQVPSAVVKVMDVKTPGAFRKPSSPPDFEKTPGFTKRHLHYPNLDLLGPRDEVKFVICDREDYRWTLDFIAEHRLAERTPHLLLSPCHGGVEPRDLVAWMCADRPPARLSLQVHKAIWGADARGV
jgi:7-carboxy-7-deazaguanine synthase